MIQWLIAHPGPGLEQKQFLCPQEVEEGRRYHHPERYRQWLLGRAAAKTLLCRHTQESGTKDLPPASIHITRMSDGWPRPLRLDGSPLPVSLSISHKLDLALCALCPEEEGTLGADIESIEPRSEHLLEDFYTDAERDLLSRLHDPERVQAITVMWCIKEAVLKARRTGFKANTKSVEIHSLPAESGKLWQHAQVTLDSNSHPQVYWRLFGNDAMALALVQLTD